MYKRQICTRTSHGLLMKYRVHRSKYLVYNMLGTTISTRSQNHRRNYEADALHKLVLHSCTRYGKYEYSPTSYEVGSELRYQIKEVATEPRGEGFGFRAEPAEGAIYVRAVRADWTGSIAKQWRVDLFNGNPLSIFSARPVDSEI